MNRYAPHVYVIPEDDANRQLADGFVLHHRVNHARIQIVPPSGGWYSVLETFRDEYIPKLRRDSPYAHVIMLIDFDDHVEKRKTGFDQEIPQELKTCVFVIGSKYTPERLKKQVNRSFEEIGALLASDCEADAIGLWGHEHLNHNEPDRQRLVQTVKPFLF